MISKSQSRRLDDQRTTFPDSAANTPDDTHPLTQGGCVEEDDLFDTLWRLQGARIDDQRCVMPSAAMCHDSVSDQDRWEEGEAECLSSDELFDMIFECQVCLQFWDVGCVDVHYMENVRSCHVCTSGCKLKLSHHVLGDNLCNLFSLVVVKRVWLCPLSGKLESSM